jgi:hypothetical protein
MFRLVAEDEAVVMLRNDTHALLDLWPAGDLRGRLFLMRSFVDRWGCSRFPAGLVDDLRIRHGRETADREIWHIAPGLLGEEVADVG